MLPPNRFLLFCISFFTRSIKILTFSPRSNRKIADSYLNTVSPITFMKTFTAILQKEENMYVAKCAEVGTVSQGSTIEESIVNLKEATDLYLEEYPLKKSAHPILTTFEVTEIGA